MLIHNSGYIRLRDPCHQITDYIYYIMQRLRRKRCSLFSFVPKRVSQVSTAHAVHVSLWSEMTNATLLSICACHPGTYEWAP